MPTSPVFWGLCALMLFWAVGAYNRLVRLRSAVVQAFGGLDAQFFKVAGLRLGHAAFLLRIKGNLNGIVAILVFRFDLGEGVALYVNDGHRHHSAGFLVKQTGHTDLFSDKS